MCKFPGGGLEFGEGTIDCLKREALEEFNCAIEVTSHYYTTDYFQPALFFENTQLISIYYKIKLVGNHVFPASEVCNYPSSSQLPNFRWVPLASLDPQILTFPIDRIVAKMILEEFSAL
jgi:8-oxo-dGTP pyrophosphatase MutT (NUDIX family)